ncbi:nitric oxide-associated protein 1 [Maniola hyperantus]|uniref:nitric oxide-associated protein 1 n=1 Tax=Aphantopus hyperantus TaxID=2795564 RepID=UPI0015683699|nr:nitric oxide-associated protein 1 [Maniola hyperantus]
MLYSVRNVWRLYRKSFSARFNHSRANESDKRLLNKDFKRLLQQHKDKIVFSSYLEHEKLQLGYYKYYVKTIRKAKEIESKEFHEKGLPPLPLSLKYYVDKERLLEDETAPEVEEPAKTFQLPFGNTTRVDINEDEIKSQENTDNVDTEFDRSNIEKWMTNYEQFDDTKLLSTEEESDEEGVENEWSKHYGTPDPTVAVSQVPCGGCGALLHCNDPAIPGYLPSELFKGRKVEELKTMECQRCHFLQEYNIALDVTVQPEEYEKLLKSIRYVKSLVLLMVDLLDFPCSIWPGIVDIIGTDRPIFIVANKVDLLPGDSIGYLKRIKESLLSEIKKTKLGEANIKYVALVSAKTGFGVEELISAMFKLWLYKGDVFLVGCTNVGKSSLFNALLQSDYCKVHAVDIVKRATVSRWPGTTLNLLKFPINRPSGWKIRERSKRLLSEAKLFKVENEIRQDQISGKKFVEPPSLICHIGRTFTEHIARDDNFAGKRQDLTVLDENHMLFKKSKWLYDTPGVIHPDQVLSLLSTEELLLTIPKKLIRPQTYYLRQGTTVLIGGLARVDLLDSTEPCRFTIFCSENLPITVINTENADEVYETFVGTELFAVPSGGMDRLRNWPGLKSKEFEFSGEGPKLCCGDVVLSSIGWVAITAKKGTKCTVSAWTPEGRGIHKRYPSVLPYSINLKQKRIQGTPAYMVGKVYTGEEP